MGSISSLEAMHLCSGSLVNLAVILHPPLCLNKFKQVNERKRETEINLDLVGLYSLLLASLTLVLFLPRLI